MSTRDHAVCPVEASGRLDTRLRRLLQNPRRILGPHLRPGMAAADLGCGPGFFTLDMARLVGADGRVVAVDLQQEMLDRLEAKLQGSQLAERVALHRCGESQLGIAAPVDFALAFYMVHELPDKARFFRELAALLSPSGAVLVVEPPLHVSRAEFRAMIETAEQEGLVRAAAPKVPLGMTALLRKPASS